LRADLAAFVSSLGEPQKVRLLLARDGQISFEATPLGRKPTIVRLGVALEPVQSRNPFLYHKTTVREMYTHAATAAPDYDDILLWNERGEVTETTTANVVFLLDGEWITPPVSSGLLAGSYRDWLLQNRLLQERVIKLATLDQVEAVGVINSVRGWRDAKIVDSAMALA
jgi:para-aminobenzoate synthetase/4-amino-4-deoxychorismate lyase